MTETTTTELPAWVEVGLPVLVVGFRGSFDRTISVREVAVTKIGKAQIITTNGRFRIADLLIVGGRQGDEHLVEPGSREATESIARWDRQEARSELRSATQAWERVDRFRSTSTPEDEVVAIRRLVDAATSMRVYLEADAT